MTTPSHQMPNRQGLVAVKLPVTRADGKTHEQTFWKSPEEAKKLLKEKAKGAKAQIDAGGRTPDDPLYMGTQKDWARRKVEAGKEAIGKAGGGKEYAAAKKAAESATNKTWRAPTKDQSAALLPAAIKAEQKAAEAARREGDKKAAASHTRQAEHHEKELSRFTAVEKAKKLELRASSDKEAKVAIQAHEEAMKVSSPVEKKWHENAISDLKADIKDGLYRGLGSRSSPTFATMRSRVVSRRQLKRLLD